MRIFEKGVVRAARNMKAVIVTGGTDAGVMKALGLAAENGSKDGHRVPVIGKVLYSL